MGPFSLAIDKLSVLEKWTLALQKIIHSQLYALSFILFYSLYHIKNKFRHESYTNLYLAWYWSLSTQKLESYVEQHSLDIFLRPDKQCN